MNEAGLTNDIRNLAAAQPKHASAQLSRSRKYAEHFGFLCERTAFAPLPDYPVSEKIWLLLNGMAEFPKCRKCGKPLRDPASFMGLTGGFRQFCSCGCSANSESTRRRRTETVRRKYGTDNVFQNEDVKRRCRETCLSHFGVRIGTLNPEVMRRQRGRRSYSADGIRFDSSLECCFYVCNRDRGVACEYAPDVSFGYSYGGKEHAYFPDFRMPDGRIVEIKGSHFFKGGKMTCPFRNRAWSDAEYEEMCGLYEAKRKCMADNDVTVLTEADLAPQLAYMKDRYGADWRRTFRRVNNSHEERS